MFKNTVPSYRQLLEISGGADFVFNISFGGDFFMFFYENTYHCIRLSLSFPMVQTPCQQDVPNFFYWPPKSKSFRLKDSHYIKSNTVLCGQWETTADTTQVPRMLCRGILDKLVGTSEYPRLISKIQSHNALVPVTMS